MSVLEQQTTNILDDTLYAKIAQISFLVYVFFVFFGTAKPFPDLTPDGSVGDGTNLINQLFSLLYLLSFLSLVKLRDHVFTFILREKYLTLFLIWALFSVTWSDYTSISLKRWVSLVGEVIICLAALMHFRWSEVALLTFRKIVLLYVPLTILAVIFVPEAIQWEFPAWRGLADTKNNLGQETLFSIIILFAIIQYNKGRAVNAIHYVVLGCALIAYLGAQSTTAFLIGGVLVGIQCVVYVGKFLRLGNFAPFFALYTILGSILVGVLIVLLAPEVLASLFGIFGKDITFSGRVDLWATVLRMTEDKALNGWGIGGFWVAGEPHLWPLTQEFVWIPNQSHQGYIDIFNQLGVIGLGMLLFIIASYFSRLNRINKPQVWKWVFLSILILNMQESVFFRPRHIGNFMFIFTYIALNTDLLKEELIRLWTHGRA